MKRLYRSRKEVVLMGVCGGLADYFHIDVVLVRLIFLILAFSGIGVLFYFLAALVLPKEPASGEVPIYDEEEKSNTSFALGAILVLIGVTLLLRRFIFPLLPHYTKDLIWPLILISAGAFLVWGRKEM